MVLTTCDGDEKQGLIIPMNEGARVVQERRSQHRTSTYQKSTS
jgi:hypothetical protein